MSVRFFVLWAIVLVSVSCCSVKTINANTVPVDLSQLESREQWRSLLSWPVACDDGVAHITNNATDFVGVEFYEWDNERYLVTVVCSTAAYNQGEMAFLEKSKNSREFVLLSFPQFAPITDAPAEKVIANTEGEAFYRYDAALLFGNLLVDTVKNEMTNNTFSRGGGGCGMSTNYSLRAGSISVKALKIQEVCGAENKAISEWPSYQASQYQAWPHAE